MPESFDEMWAALLPIGRTGTGGYDRRGLGEVERQLHDWLACQGQARGLEAERDGVGNTFLWWGTGSDAVIPESLSPAVAFDPVLVQRIAELLDAPALPTYAGYDAGVLQAAGIPTAVLLVRNPTGVSPSPAEHATPEDRRSGVGALATVLGELAS